MDTSKIRTVFSRNFRIRDAHIRPGAKTYRPGANVVGANVVGTNVVSTNRYILALFGIYACRKREN